MLHLLQMSPFKVLTTLLLYIQNSWQLSFPELPPCCVPGSSGDNTVTYSSDSSSWYTSIVQSGFPSANAALCPTLVFKPLIPLLPTSCHLPLHLQPPPHAPCCLSAPPASSSPLTPSGLFNEMLGVSEPGELNFYTFFRLILLTLFVSKNLTSIHFPLSISLDSLLCNLIAPTPGPAFSLLMPCTPVVFFIRQSLSFSELSTFSLFSLDTYPNYVGVNSSLNNSFLLSFLNAYVPLICFFRRIAEPIPFLLQKSIHSGGLLLASSPLGLKRYFRPRWSGRI